MTKKERLLKKKQRRNGEWSAKENDWRRWVATSGNTEQWACYLFGNIWTWPSQWNSWKRMDTVHESWELWKMHAQFLCMHVRYVKRSFPACTKPLGGCNYFSMIHLHYCFKTSYICRIPCNSQTVIMSLFTLTQATWPQYNIMFARFHHECCKEKGSHDFFEEENAPESIALLKALSRGSFD